MRVAASRLALDLVSERGEPSRIGEAPPGEAPRKRTGCPGGQGERAGDHVRHLRNGCHGKVVLPGGARHDAGSQAAIKTTHGGERATPGMIRTDRDSTAVPELALRCGIAASFPAEHRMRADERDLASNARAGGPEDRLFDAGDIRQDRAVLHQRRNGSEQRENLANRRAEHDEITA